MSGAYEDALRLLSSRSLTRREVGDKLRAKGHEAGAIDDALARLLALGAVDDKTVARSWIASTAARSGRGRDRAIAELTARGVDEEIARSAWASAVEDGAVDQEALLGRAVSRRLGTPPRVARRARLARVYNALLFEGFAPRDVETALLPYGFERTEDE